MIKLIKHIIIILFVLVVGDKTFAQVRPYRVAPRQNYNNNNSNHTSDPEVRVEAVKERFLRERLGLSPDQERRFFPVYREYQRELFNIRRLKRLNNSSADGTQQIDKDLQYDADLVAIKLKFKDAFLKIMSPEKLSELYKSERDFTDELVRSLSERNAHQGN